MEDLEALKKEERKEKMQPTDIDTSIYEEVIKGYRYSGFGLGEFAHIAKQVEAELDVMFELLNEKERREEVME